MTRRCKQEGVKWPRPSTEQRGDYTVRSWWARAVRRSRSAAFGGFDAVALDLRASAAQSRAAASGDVLALRGFCDNARDGWWRRSLRAHLSDVVALP